MPTSEMRTQASMTMPLSSTRSSTSIRLVPPGALSTAIWSFLSSENGSKLRSAPGGGGARRQVRVVAPPVQADLLGLVNRADEQTDLERQKLDVRQRDLDVARDDQPLVEDAVEHVN